MSLEKAIEHHKEHRKEYYGCQVIDHTCRPHGTCDYCRDGRLHKYKKRMLEADEDAKFDYDDEGELDE